MALTTNKPPVMEMKNLSKRFDATQALDDVSLEIFPGEVHAVVGENGAGKSTLIKIMTGIHPPDTGEILLEGKPVRIGNAQEAQALGIAAIYQEPMVFPDLDVAENIFISHQDRGRVMHWKKMYEDAEAILAQLDVKLDVRQQARGLTLASQQAVEIAKAISLKVKVLIMDEPTASLSAHEVARLFKLVKALKGQGVAVLFIGHRMEEVLSIADRVTVLRDGKYVSSRPRNEVTIDQVIRDMVGRTIDDFFSHTTAEKGGLVLSVRNLSREGAFRDVSFDLFKGEVLGFAGLVGARRTDVGLALFGVEPAESGQVTIDGAAGPREERIHTPEQAMELGIAYLSEDRRKLGLSIPMSIATNISLPTLRRYLSRFGLVNRKAEADAAEGFRQRLSIRAASVKVEVGKLSGGNQQKVMLSKWLNVNPKVLILDEPTRGIDVRAKAEVHHLINELAQRGLGIIMISSDLPEVLAMSDRILVMREGRQMGIFSREEASQETIMTAAMGQDRSNGGGPRVLGGG